MPYEKINFINELPPRFTLIKSIACGLALLASGQALALTVYVSASSTIVDADLNNSAKWAVNGTCGDPAGPAGPITMANSDIILVCLGNSLNLSSAATVNASIIEFKSTGMWGGTSLKFSAGNKTVYNNANTSLSAIPLNVSGMTTGSSIYIDAFGLSVTFSSITGGTLDCATSYPATITAGTTCNVTVGGGAISAPIDLKMNKPVESYSTEIKLK